MGLAKNFFSQTRKPEGFLGKMMLGTMNSGHAKLADWGFTHLPEITPESAVDLGCGGGRNAGELLKKYPKAHVTAVDYSDLSVAKAREYNKTMIAAGRCEVLQVEKPLDDTVHALDAEAQLPVLVKVVLRRSQKTAHGMTRKGFDGKSSFSKGDGTCLNGNCEHQEDESDGLVRERKLKNWLDEMGW